MVRDSAYSYVHIDDPNHVLFIERWVDEPIPYDDIDTEALYEATASLFPSILLEEEEDGTLAMSPAAFGAKVKNRKLTEKAWSDVDVLDRFLDEKSPRNQHTDQTILKPLHTRTSSLDEVLGDDAGDKELNIARFMANGHQAKNDMDILSPENDSVIHQGDISMNSDLVGGANNTFLNLRNHSIGSNQPSANNSFQTPRMKRTRQMSTDKNFQTPITRIMR